MTSMDERIANLEGRFSGYETALPVLMQRIGSTLDEMRAGNAELRAELRADMADLKASRATTLTIALGFGGLIISVLAVAAGLYFR